MLQVCDALCESALCTNLFASVCYDCVKHCCVCVCVCVCERETAAFIMSSVQHLCVFSVYVFVIRDHNPTCIHIL